ncbi:ribonuclease P protein component [Helicobacter sp. T3_23-1056]
MQTLKTKKEFDFVYKNGFLRYGRDFAIYVYKENPQHLQSKNAKNTLPKQALDSQNATFSKENSERSEYDKLEETNDFRESKAISKSMESKIGLSVSKKIGNAVTRNKIKRRVRAILRECRDFREIENGFRIIFVAKVGISALSFAELKHSFESTLRFSLDRLSSNKFGYKRHTQRTQQTQQISNKTEFKKIYDKKYDKTNDK